MRPHTHCVLANSGSIVDASSEEAIFPREIETPVINACRTDVRSRDQLSASGQVHNYLPILKFGLDSFADQQDLRAKVDGLLSSSFGQVCTTDAAGEAQVILDLGAGSSLPADGGPLNQDTFQSFGRSIYRRAQTSRPRSIDRDVVLFKNRLRDPA
jgi:hypothetical protein